RGEHPNFTLLQSKVGGLLVGEKFIAGGDNAAVEIHQELRWVFGYLSRLPAIAARPVPRKFQAPVERTHHTVVVHRGELVLPVIHPLCVARGHGQSSSVTSGRRAFTRESVNGRNQRLAPRICCLTGTGNLGPHLG